ncbi:hypothetical protein BBO_02048 [Beauveria brongniartii RCEF 3172]|uniref:Uncharacterized protein n=1 Tax=Beauveria brongniartii RCEF 3172 TaxID=1081107 RepID=A0A167IEZ9_9HYPO|nr:hypothetical protein BBO_02048 [Beauveria brongniartii RCEF 3172]
MLLGLYCCDAQLCGVDNIALPGFDPNVDLLINVCASFDDHNEHNLDKAAEHIFNELAEYIFDDRVNSIFDDYAEHYWDHRLVE